VELGVTAQLLVFKRGVVMKKWMISVLILLYASIAGAECFIDCTTGLTWSREIVENVKLEDLRMTLKDLNDSNYCGYSNWRVPKDKELTELSDYSRIINPKAGMYYSYGGILGGNGYFGRGMFGVTGTEYHIEVANLLVVRR
jgi:hypothetical protein